MRARFNALQLSALTVAMLALIFLGLAPAYGQAPPQSVITNAT